MGAFNSEGDIEGAERMLGGRVAGTKHGLHCRGRDELTGWGGGGGGLEEEAMGESLVVG